jgi:hypothetical protein
MILENYLKNDEIDIPKKCKKCIDINTSNCGIGDQDLVKYICRMEKWCKETN